MSIAPNNPAPQKSLRFGSGVGHEPKLSKAAQGAEKVMGVLGKSRGQQMIMEDFVGFGGLRSLFDLSRGHIFGTGILNWPAASERLIREGASIFTDNMLSGIVAQWIGKAFDGGGKSFSNGFTDYPTLEAFQKAVGTEHEGFIDRLSAHLLKDSPKRADFQNALLPIWKALPTRTEKPEAAKVWANTTKTGQAKQLAKALDQTHFDLKVGEHTFKLDNLLDDLRIFKDHMATRLPNGTGNAWAEAAQDSIKNTLTAKNWKLSAIALGMGATFAVPFANSMLTRWRYGINYYPGEMGLGQNRAKPGTRGSRVPSRAGLQQPSINPSFKERLEAFGEKRMPYVTRKLKDGNPLPLLAALAPLPFVVGLFDVSAREFVGPSILKLWNQTSRHKLRNMFDFTKGWPFTAPQQMGSMFALLITSRLMCARSDNEYKELMLDSAFGWGWWMVGTPVLQKFAGKALDKGWFPFVDKTQLMNGKSVRTKAEIELLGELAEKKLTGEALKAEMAMIQRTMNASVWMRAMSMITTFGILGIGIPYAAIKMTQRNEARKQKRADARAPQPLATLSVPLAPGVRPVAVALNPFGASSPVNQTAAMNAPFAMTRPGFGAGTVSLNNPLMPLPLVAPVMNRPQWQG